jgi:putative inorganic carbon (HCO3(-)) transporter
MRDLIVFGIVFSFLPLAFVHTPIGILLWNWIGFMNPHRLGWGYAYHFQFAVLIGGVTLISFVFSKYRRAIPMPPPIVLLLLFILWMNVTTIFSLVPDDAWNQWEKIMKIQLFMFITLSVMQERKFIMQLLWTIVFSISYFGYKGGVFTVLSGGGQRVFGPTGSQIEDNNTLALALIMVVPLLVFLFKQTKNKWIKYFLLAGCFLCAFSILGSQSRGALLASCAMVIFLILRSRKKVVFITVLAIFVPILVTFMPSNWFDRMNTIQTYEEDLSAMGRINAWHFAHNLAKARPLVGGGFEAFRPHLFEQYAPIPEQYHDAHSIYFEVLGEQGFVGLFLFISILLSTWFLGSVIRHRTGKDPNLSWAYELASMIQVSLIGYMVGGAFLGVAYFDLLYSLVVIMVLVHHEVKKSLKICPKPLSHSESNELNYAT